jgi:WD40 repeat protein
MKDAFISYSRRDEAFVRRLFDALVGVDRDIWLDRENIPLTADWFEEIKSGIEESNAFIFVISPDSVQSEICRAELEHAVANNKRFVPLLYRDLVDEADKAALHPKVSSHNWVFFRESDGFEPAFEALADALDTDLNHVRIHTRILMRTIEWDRSDHDPSFLLRGSDLKSAEDWLAEAEGKEPDVTTLQKTFVQESRLAENRRRRERMFLIALSVLFVAAVVASIVALIQYREARIAQEQAQRLSLAANSRVALGNYDTDLAIALALQANEGDVPLNETERALADAAYSPGTYFVARVSAELSVGAVAYSPDGSLVAGAVQDKLYLWNTENNDMVAQLTGHLGAITAIAFSPDGQYVATGSSDSTIRVWEIETQEVHTTLRGHNGKVRTLVYRWDGQRILSGGSDRQICLWDPDEEDPVHCLEGHYGTVVAVAFRPGHPEQAISMALDTTPFLWDVETGEILQRYSRQLITNEPNLDHGALAFTPDGDSVVSSYGINLRLWDVETGRTQSEFIGHGSYVNAIAFDSERMVVYSSARFEDVIRVWDVSAGVELYRLRGHSDIVRGVAISPEGRFVLSGSDDGSIRFWDTFSGADVRTLQGHQRDVYGLAFSPDGSLLASAGDDAAIRLWEWETGEMVGRLAEHTGDVWTVDFSPDGAYLISGAEDNFFNLWDVEAQELAWANNDHEDWVTAVAFSPEWPYAVSGSNDQTIRYWNMETHEQLWCVGELDGCTGANDGSVRSVVFSQDGSQILVGANEARIFDAATGELLHEIEVNKRVNSAVFAPRIGTILTGSSDSTIQLWDIATGQEIKRFDGHNGQTRSVAFSPDGTYILSASADGTIRLWDVDGGLEVRRFEGHAEWVNRAIFSPDGQYAASASWDDTIKIWHIHDLAELEAWLDENRFVRPGLTCFEQDTYLVTGRDADCDPAIR